MPRLQVGDRFRLHPSCLKPGEESPIYVVTRVSQCSASVRSQAKEHVVIPAPDGTPAADFWRPGRTVQISPNSSVVLIEEER